MITVGGKTFTIATSTKTKYIYDAQDRLVVDRRVQVYGKTDSVTYSYSPTQVIVRQAIYVKPDAKYYNQLDTLHLNSRGLALNHQDGYPVLEYDSNGYLIKALGDYEQYILSVENGNVKQAVSYAGGGFGNQTDKFDYYPNRPNLPTLITFYGKANRNFQAGFVRSLEKSNYYSDGLKYQVISLYEFDSWGRVKRKIDFGTRLSADWPFVPAYKNGDTLVSGIGVTDYEYECL